jgi:hypothetical protein
MGLNRPLVLAPAAHSCPVEYLVSKIERFSSDTNNQGLKSCKRTKRSPDIEESEKDDNPTRLSKPFNHGTKVKTSLIFFPLYFQDAEVAKVLQ